MKLKPFNKRLHNIFFHTHTVAGIVISFALYIVFFAGAFALFMDEGYRWENPEARYETPATVDIDRAFKNVKALFPNMDKLNNISVVMPTPHNPELRIYANAFKEDSTMTRVSGLVNTQTYEATSFKEQKTHMIETLYHLHFFDQIPYGIYIAGFTALFFLFAIITGLLIHWEDIVEKFYMLRTKSGWKNLWKDTHTTLSLIGLPFQIIYGVTGSLLGLSILFLAPSVVLLFNGSQDEVRGMLDPFFQHVVDKTAEKSDDTISLNKAYQIVKEKYPDYPINFLRLRNYGTEKAVVAVRLNDHETIFGNGSIVVDLTSGEIIGGAIPNNKGYGGVYDLMIKLHYATFGGIWMKIIYFLLSMLTCFVIISGVLLWQSSRDNKKYTDQQRLFHHRVTKSYLNICFSLFPAVTVLFLANMAVSMEMENRIPFVDAIFFGSWLLFFLSGFRLDNYRAITKYFLILGMIGAFLIPLFNGIFTGDWLWTTISNGEWHVAIMDLVWLMVGGTCLWFWQKWMEEE